MTTKYVKMLTICILIAILTFYIEATVLACNTGGIYHVPNKAPTYNDGFDPPEDLGDIYIDHTRYAYRNRITSQGHVYVKAKVFPVDDFGGHYKAHDISCHGWAKMMGYYTFVEPGGDYITEPKSMDSKGSVASTASYALNVVDSIDGVVHVNFYARTLPTEVCQALSPELRGDRTSGPDQLSSTLSLTIASTSWTPEAPSQTFDLNRISATAYASTDQLGESSVWASGSNQVSSWLLIFGSPNY